MNLHQIINNWIGENYTNPYERKSPFPNESVEHHLKSYGHLPEKNCCRNDQFSKQEVIIANQALEDLRNRIPELVEEISNYALKKLEHAEQKLLEGFSHNIKDCEMCTLTSKE